MGIEEYSNAIMVFDSRLRSDREWEDELRGTGNRAPNSKAFRRRCGVAWRGVARDVLSRCAGIARDEEGPF